MSEDVCRRGIALEEGPLWAALAASVCSAAALEGYASLKTQLRAAILSDPFDATVATVLGGSLLFYLAEKGHNPKVRTYQDALVFISTCLSVGYADVFARTPAGKAIASAVMTLGPAMSGALLDKPPAPSAGDKNASEPVVERLDAILRELRALRAGTTRST